ncbi:PAS domain S-box protein [Ferruginibacter sp.]
MENEKHYRDLIQNLPEAIYTCDETGVIKLYNKAAVNLWGRVPVEGKDLWCGSWKIFNAKGAHLPFDKYPMAIAVKESRTVYGTEIVIQRPDGSVRHVNPYTTPLFNAEGQLTGAVNILKEVTQKEDIQKQGEEKYKTLIEQASDAILIYSFDGTIHEFNKSCYTLLGYSQQEYATLKLNDILVGDIIVNQANYTAILAGHTKTLYRYLKRKDGTLIETEVTVKILADGKAIAFARDITERKKAEKDLEQMKQELMDQKIQEQKKITRAIIKAEEKERRHIGEELHDNINQMLAGTKLYLSAAGNNNKELKELVQYPIRLIEDTMKEIRLLTSKVVTPIQNIDLKELVQSLLEALDKTTVIKTLFTYNVINNFRDDDLKLNIYRIIQEQTNNIIKHAEAGNIEILIEVDNHIINIAVTDDGNGFDVCKKREGIGISNIINRVESFNGKAVLKSSKGKGCVLQIKIPLI